MSANKTPLRGERRRFEPARSPLETPHNRRVTNRKNTPARGGGVGMFDADANAGAVREEMADALEPPGYAQGGAQAGQAGAADIRGEEEREGEEGLPPGNNPPPPLNNNPDRLRDCINALWALMVLVWALIGSLKQHQPKLVWSFAFTLLLLLLLVGYISTRSSTFSPRLDPDMDMDFVVSEPLSKQQLAEQRVRVDEWTREMREMRGSGDEDDAEVMWW